MSVKNLIVKGKFFRWVSEGQTDPKKISQEMDNIKSVFVTYFENAGYYQKSLYSELYNYANFEFELNNIFIPPENAASNKGLLKFFKFKKEVTYFEKLRNLTPGAPTRINLNIIPGLYKDQSVIFIEVISEPAIIRQYQQLQIRRSLNQDDIDLIIYENEQSIERFRKACLLTTIDQPSPLGSFFKTEITEKLKIFGFEEISKLLDNGREDIEKGNTEDGLVDLRTAIERFFVMIIESKGQKAAPQKDVNKNIDKLQGFGYIDEQSQELLIKLCYNGLYTTLSQVTHDRVSRDLFDSRFQFNIAEQIFDYVLERVIKFKLISIPTKNKNPN